MNQITNIIINSIEHYDEVISLYEDIKTDDLFTPVETFPVEIIRLTPDNIEEDFNIIAKYPFEIVTNTGLIKNGIFSKMVEIRTPLSLSLSSYDNELIDFCWKTYDLIGNRSYNLKGLNGRLMLYCVLPENNVSYINIKTGINLLETVAREYRNRFSIYGFIG